MCIDIFVCLLPNLLNSIANAATVQFFYELLFQMGLYDIWRPHTNLWSQLNAERVQKWLLWCLSNNGNHFIWESGSGDARDLLSHWCSQISQSIFWTTIMSSMNSGVFCVIWILKNPISELHSFMGTCTQMPFLLIQGFLFAKLYKMTCFCSWWNAFKKVLHVMIESHLWKYKSAFLVEGWILSKEITIFRPVIMLWFLIELHLKPNKMEFQKLISHCATLKTLCFYCPTSKFSLH